MFSKVKWFKNGEPLIEEVINRVPKEITDFTAQYIKDTQEDIKKAENRLNSEILDLRKRDLELTADIKSINDRRVEIKSLVQKIDLKKLNKPFFFKQKILDLRGFDKIQILFTLNGVSQVQEFLVPILLQNPDLRYGIASNFYLTLNKKDFENLVFEIHDLDTKINNIYGIRMYNNE